MRDTQPIPDTHQRLIDDPKAKNNFDYEELSDGDSSGLNSELLLGMTQENGDKNTQMSTDGEGKAQMRHILKLQAALLKQKERNFDLESSIKVYKEMLIERDRKIKNLQDSLLKNPSGVMAPGGGLRESIMVTLG